MSSISGTSKKPTSLLKEAREQGKIAFFRHTKLIIRDRMTQKTRTTSDDTTRTGDGGDVMVVSRSTVDVEGPDVTGGRSASSTAATGDSGGADGVGVTPAASAAPYRGSNSAGDGEVAVAESSARGWAGVVASSHGAGGDLRGAAGGSSGGSFSDPPEGAGAGLRQQKGLRSRRK